MVGPMPHPDGMELVEIARPARGPASAEIQLARESLRSRLA